MNQRICFCLQVKRDRLAEYKQRHGAVWPEMLDALRHAGWPNCSLFLRNEGLLIGYLETPDFERVLSEMAKTGVNRRWQMEMMERGCPQTSRCDRSRRFSTSTNTVSELQAPILLTRKKRVPVILTALVKASMSGNILATTCGFAANWRYWRIDVFFV